MQAVASRSAASRFRWRPSGAAAPCGSPSLGRAARRGLATARAHSNTSPDGNDPFIDATLRLQRLISGVG
jgi:hypothetical protein